MNAPLFSKVNRRPAPKLEGSQGLLQANLSVPPSQSTKAIMCFATPYLCLENTLLLSLVRGSLFVPVRFRRPDKQRKSKSHSKSGILKELISSWALFGVAVSTEHLASR